MKIKIIKKILRIGFIGIIVMIGFIVSGCQQNKKQMNKDYPGLTDKDHVYEPIKVDDVKKMIDQKENFYLVMGFSNCPWCQALIPVLNEVAKDHQAKTIYYLDILDIRDNETADGYGTFHALTDGVFGPILDKEKNRVNAPTFIKVEQGNVVMHHLNTVNSHIKNENGYLPPLTSEQLNELKKILDTFF